MKGRGFLFLLLLGLNLFWALSTGGRLYLLFFLVMACMLALSLVSVCWARLTLRVEVRLPQPRVDRQDEVEVVALLGCRCLLPVAPVLLTLLPPDAGPPIEARVTLPLFRQAACAQRLYCPHVGAFTVGLSQVVISDVFSIFALRLSPKDGARTLFVRPRVGEVRPLAFSPAEADHFMLARATEDTSAPADTRLWQEGDPLKRVHWKLSARRQELLVRTFEEPMRPDALLLLNCAPPPGDAETAATLRDVVCETVASLAAAQLREGHPVRLPLVGAQAREIDTEDPARLQEVLDGLAEQPFDGAQAFEQVLMMQLRRLRRTGVTAVVTASLDSNIADLAIQMRRRGPDMRLYYAHAGPIDGDTELLLSRLEKHNIEVETIALVQGLPEEHSA